jgi:hypothetical protein
MMPVSGHRDPRDEEDGMAEKEIQPQQPETSEPAAGARKVERTSAKKTRLGAKKTRLGAKKTRLGAKKQGGVR